MKYTREERQEIGRRIYKHELTCQQAAEEYGIHIHTAKRFRATQIHCNTFIRTASLARSFR